MRNYARNGDAHLVLEDGTVFPGRSSARRGVAAGEACFTTAIGRLRGGGHRPELRARRCSASPIRSSATTASTSALLESEPRLDRGRRHAARPARVVARGSRDGASSRSRTVDTRALVRRIRDGGAHALRARRRAAGRAACARARGAAHRLAADARRAGARLAAARARGLRRRSRTRVGARPARRRARPRLQALDRATGSPQRASRRRRSRHLGRRRDPRARAARGAVGNGPGDPAQLVGPVETVRDAARPGAALRHLPRPPAARARARPADLQAARSATAARTIRCACAGSSRVLVTVQNHGFAVEAGDAAEVSHVSLNDGTVEGLDGDGFATCSSTPRRRPARSTPCPSSTASPTHAEAHRPSQHPDRRLRADPHRAGVRVRLLRGAGLPRRCGAEGYRVVLVNSNPATIMTDPEWADATYLEPLDADDGRAGDRARSGPTRSCRRSAARRRSTSRSSWPSRGSPSAASS